MIRSHYESLREIIHVGKWNFHVIHVAPEKFQINTLFCMVELMNTYHLHLYMGNLVSRDKARHGNS